MLFIFLWLTIWSIGAAFLLVLVVKSWMDGSIHQAAVIAGSEGARS